MKRIGIALLIFLGFLVFKFSSENLSGFSFFLKAGCNSNSNEYSLFLETGSKPQPIYRQVALPFSYQTPEVEKKSTKDTRLNKSENFVKQNILVEGEVAEEFTLAATTFNQIPGIQSTKIRVVEIGPILDEWGYEIGSELITPMIGYGERKEIQENGEVQHIEWTFDFCVEGESEFEGIAIGYGAIEAGQRKEGIKVADWVVDLGFDTANEFEGITSGYGIGQTLQPNRETELLEWIFEVGANEASVFVEIVNPYDPNQERPTKSDFVFEEVKPNAHQKEELTDPVKSIEPMATQSTTEVERTEEERISQLPFTPITPVALVKQPESPKSATVSEAESSYDPYLWPKRLTIRHVVGDQERDCIPFATNYTSVEIFSAPDYRPGHMYPFIDLRGHRFDNNTYAANGGIGGRYVPNDSGGFCEMLGFNVYYDYRQGCVGYYQQIGAGIEVLGRRWDFRANAYAPFGARRHIKTCFFNDYEGDFFALRRDIESVSYSFNGEVGYLAINGENFSFYMAAGPYFLARGKCCTSTVGVEARIRPKYKDYVALDLSARYDDLFGTIWQASIIFNLPLYQISKINKRPCGLRDWQIYQPVERFEVMPLSKRSCWETNF